MRHWPLAKSVKTVPSFTFSGILYSLLLAFLAGTTFLAGAAAFGLATRGILWARSSLNSGQV